MALTYTFDANSPQIDSKQRRVKGTVTFDSSYATGGLTVTPASLGLTSITDIEVHAQSADYRVNWNRSTSAPKLLAYQGDNANASAAPGIEVPNTTNLSTLVCRFTAWGF